MKHLMLITGSKTKWPFTNPSSNQLISSPSFLCFFPKAPQNPFPLLISLPQTRSISSMENNNNMSSYSKMTMKPNTTNFTSPKPKSMDFSELIHENNFNQHGHLKIMEEEEDEDSTVNGEQFGDILRRNRSSASQRFRSSEKGTSSLQDVVKRAFSMRRPSSVAECYWRFHDFGDGVMVHEDDEEQQQQETKRCSKRKGRRFFKACKSFLKF